MAVIEADGLPRPRRRAVADARPARPVAVARAGWFPWLPVWLACGIGLWFALKVEPGVPAYGAAALLALAGLAISRAAPRGAERMAIPWAAADALRLAGFALAVAALGFGLAGLRSHLVAAPVLQFRYYGPVEGRLVEIDRSARDRMRLTLDQVTLRNMAPERTPDQVRLSLTETPARLPEVGARIMLTGHLGPPPGPAAPGSFDFRRQAWFERLGAVGYSRTPVMLVAPAAERGPFAVERLRNRASAAIQSEIPGQAGAVASALLTGDRSGIEERTNAIMRDSNLYHIVSISGLHMSMLAGFVYAAMRTFLAAVAAAGIGAGRPGHKLAALTALAAAAAYMRLADGGPATERAFVMVAVFLGAILADRRAISLRTVALAALILLALAPEALTQPGFQMSFAATVALILSYEPWSRLSPRVPRLLRPVAMLVLSSAVAGFSTAPLAAAHFNRLSEYGLIANLLAVPAMGILVMPAGVVAALLMPVGLAGPALWVMGLGTGWMLAVAERVAALGGAVTAVPAPPGPTLALIGLGAVILSLLRPGGRPAPRAVQAAGLAALIAGSALWATTPRPLLLVGREAEAVGLMTGAGRALSKPGAAFTTGSWLEEDGDTAAPETAAERPGWDGPRGARRAALPDGRTVHHLTGKGTEEALAGACRDGALVIAAARLDPPAKADCRLLDLQALGRTGALALWPDGRETTAEATAGRRP
ncbi:DUF4131 domain-containing protein [Paracoccus sp. S-4012]|uniref:ComEC/Rec2 family competence protein n=1 Tax=Paracoccus sp. S-4012 TaxID=2665648 RepID=UPI0012AF0F20|nr:ComEC/Rec2 family competence protein [Paracoccus sp. S-4012]MRX50130.1 DUF4131 domain-containing protein [Paracoccus sp. S-4012]